MIYPGIACELKGVGKAAALIATLWVGVAPATFAAAPAATEKAPAAPVPARLPSGEPNWTGFWTTPGGLLDVYRGPGGVSKPVAGPASSTGVDGRPAPMMVPFVIFPPVKSPYKEQLAEFRKQAASGLVADPAALCFPPGMPRMMVMVYGMEFLQTPGQITITSEWQAASRRIWMNDKAHPSEDELDPTYTGHSIGHWEGDTLVVDTVGIRKDVPLDLLGALKNSGKVHIVERFTQTSPGILVNELVIEDPDVFGEGVPWKQTATYKFRPDLRLQEYTCLENNRNVGASGEAVFK